MRVIAINNGYYYIKSLNESMFRSLYREASFEEYGNGNDIVSLDGEKLYVIGDGNMCIEKDKTTSISTKLFILTMLSKQMRFDKSETFKVYLTAPPMTYSAQKKSLPEFLKGTYEFLFNGVIKHITISDVVVYPETIMAYIANIDNRLLDTNKPTLVIDIGGFTTNIAYIVNGNYNNDSLVSFQNGMYQVEESVKSHLSSVYLNLSFDKISMQNFLRSGLIDETKKINILEEQKESINKIFNMYIDNIIEKAKIKGWSPELCNILLTGGGGSSLYSNIKAKYDHALLSETPIFDNLKGMQTIISKELITNALSSAVKN